MTFPSRSRLPETAGGKLFSEPPTEGGDPPTPPPRVHSSYRAAVSSRVMPSSAFAGGDAGRRPLRELQRSADVDRPAAHRRDARVKASAKDDAPPRGAAPARALEDPALRSSLQGLAERILAEAPSRDDDDDDDDDDAGGDANLRGETGDAEATSRKKMANNTLAYAAANSTAVNARGAVLAERIGHIARSTAASRARSRSATPSPERGGRPGRRPDGAPRDRRDEHLGRHRRGRSGGSGRRASPEVRACAEATDRLVAAVTRQRAATAARGLVFEDASAEGTEGTEGTDDDDDDDARRARRPSRNRTTATRTRRHRHPPPSTPSTVPFAGSFAGSRAPRRRRARIRRNPARMIRCTLTRTRDP